MSTAPRQRAHPDFPLRGFVRCASCGRGFCGSWPLIRSAASQRRDRTLTSNSARSEWRRCSSGQFSGHVELPGTMTRGVWAAAGVVVIEAGEDIRRQADIEVRLGVGTLENVDESPVFRHTRRKATRR